MWPISKLLQNLPLIMSVIDGIKGGVIAVKAYLKKKREEAHKDAIRALDAAESKDQIEDAIKDISKNG